ncbi:MAG: Eco57I restriction-modification methylase domain-containing protein, partial [Flavobacteriales bacterium]
SVVSNERFLDIVRHLAFTVKDGVSRSVDFRNLGSEELGSVYEGLLALTPKIEGGGHRFLFEELSGNQRKTSGSYYTPDSLVRQLLETALEPVVQERLQHKELAEQEQAILGMAVCDPAAGSGHFLVGAAHYLAERLGGIRARLAGEDDPTPELYQQALRDVIAHCIYGVDMNPMAVELCKVTLWMESMEPGRPLGFLEHHIRLGNSLVGAPKDAYAIGIPDGAFKGLEGDDKTALKELKKLNRQRSRKSVSTGLFEGQPESVTDLRAPFSALEQMPDDSLASIADKHRAYEQLRSSDAFQEEKRILDAWTAAFFVPKSVELNPLRYHGITNDHLDVLAGKKSPSPNLAVDEEAIESWTAELRFFHWHLEFPLVMERGGFDVMLGNPPWERVKIQRVEWFAQRLPSINAVSTSAKRKAAIAELEVSSPAIFAAFKQDEALALAISGFLRHSGLYPLGGCGDVNYANVFAELFLRRIGDSGLFGAVLPSGVCTGD